MTHTMQIYSSSPVILDGGLGTALEEQCQSDSPLWSTQQVIDNPSAITRAHLSFMQAGARIILTSTYQASLETFRRAGYSDAKASKTMIKSVQLANDARTYFMKETVDADVKIALSLGPFGATLSPPQEFDGYYPLPYGPGSFSETNIVFNSFDKDDVERERESIDALAQFHLNRLLLYARDPATWDMVDLIAFETVPLVREVTAIRKAMLSFQNVVLLEGKKVVLKPWWISFVLPGGKCPQTWYPGGPNMTVHDLVHAALSSAICNVADLLPSPTGVGINCTSPELIPRLAQEMAEAVESLHLTIPHIPWLILYPNNGDIFDKATRTWIDASRDAWAVNFTRGVRELSRSHRDKWSGLVVGGCCRTNPRLISSLKELLF